jgi:ATP-dependent protease ClpP protease subunit
MSSGAAMPQAEDMAHEQTNPAFSERVRDQLLLRRVLVLDGVLDDDNGTLLTAQAALEYGLVDQVLGQRELS